MNKFVLPIFLSMPLLLLSSVLIGIQYALADSNPVWGGNVTLAEMGWSSAGTPVVNFEWDGHKHGFTEDSAVVARFATHDLPYLYCTVSRTGRGTCYPPKRK